MKEERQPMINDPTRFYIRAAAWVGGRAKIKTSRLGFPWAAIFQLWCFYHLLWFRQEVVWVS